MTKLQIGFMRELRNDQFAILIKATAKALSGIETNEQPLKQLLERIQFHSDEMYYLEDQASAHPLTEVIGKLTQQRTNYLISLRLQVEGKMLTNKPYERTAANRLQLWLQNNKKYLYVASIIPQGGQIMAMLAEKHRYPEIHQALVDLGLDDLLEAIVEVTAQIEKQEINRIKSNAKKTRNGKALRRAAYIDMQKLMNLLEVMRGVHPEKSRGNIYLDMTLSVADQLKRSHTGLKSRNTKRTNKKNLTSAVAKLVRSIKGKEKAIIPNKKLSEIISEEYLKKESRALVFSMAEVESELKGPFLIKESKGKEPIGKDWEWKFPQIGVN